MKNINIVNKIVAKKLDKPLSLVNLVNHYYWKTSKEKLTNYEVTTIFWKHIGSITISKYKVYREIERIIKRIRNIALNEVYSQEAKDSVTEQQLVKLRKLLKHRNQIAQDEYDKRISEVNDERIKELQGDI